MTTTPAVQPRPSTGRIMLFAVLATMTFGVCCFIVGIIVASDMNALQPFIVPLVIAVAVFGPASILFTARAYYLASRR